VKDPAGLIARLDSLEKKSSAQVASLYEADITFQGRFE